jgi:hypothetical protein
MSFEKPAIPSPDGEEMLEMRSDDTSTSAPSSAQRELDDDVDSISRSATIEGLSFELDAQRARADDVQQALEESAMYGQMLLARNAELDFEVSQLREELVSRGRHRLESGAWRSLSIDLENPLSSNVLEPRWRSATSSGSDGTRSPRSPCSVRLEEQRQGLEEECHRLEAENRRLVASCEQHRRYEQDLMRQLESQRSALEASSAVQADTESFGSPPGRSFVGSWESGRRRSAFDVTEGGHEKLVKQQAELQAAGETHSRLQAHLETVEAMYYHAKAEAAELTRSRALLEDRQTELEEENTSLKTLLEQDRFMQKCSTTRSKS